MQLKADKILWAELEEHTETKLARSQGRWTKHGRSIDSDQELTIFSSDST